MALRGTWMTSRRARLARFVARPLATALLPPSALRAVRRRRMRRSVPAWAGPALREELAHIDDSPKPTSNQILSGDPRRARLRAANDYLDLADHAAQLEIAGGCPRRSPYLDDELVDFVASIPAEYFFAGGYSRGLLRLAMRGLVPDGVRLREDKASPILAIARLFELAGGRELLRSLRPIRALADLDLIEPGPFDAELEQLLRAPSASPNLWMSLWPVLAAEAFARGHALQPMTRAIP
jgi:hypothetical protein